MRKEQKLNVYFGGDHDPVPSSGIQIKFRKLLQHFEFLKNE